MGTSSLSSAKASFPKVSGPITACHPVHIESTEPFPPHLPGLDQDWDYIPMLRTVLRLMVPLPSVLGSHQLQAILPLAWTSWFLPCLRKVGCMYSLTEAGYQHSPPIPVTPSGADGPELHSCTFAWLFLFTDCKEMAWLGMAWLGMLLAMTEHGRGFLRHPGVSSLRTISQSVLPGTSISIMWEKKCFCG